MREVEMFLIYSSLESSLLGTSLVVPVARTVRLHCSGTGFILGQGIKIPQLQKLAKNKLFKLEL